MRINGDGVCKMLVTVPGNGKLIIKIFLLIMIVKALDE